MVDNTAPFNLKVGTQSLALYAQTPELTHYEPFGKTWDNVISEPDPRYTDHEYDIQTGFNYMKGRYQLPDYGRFNRPDPARDWDWENPASINLYQYVGNSPIDSWDPFGFYVFESTGDEEQDRKLQEQFQAALDKLRNSEDGDIRETAEAYGEFGDDSVVISFNVNNLEVGESAIG